MAKQTKESSKKSIFNIDESLKKKLKYICYKTDRTQTDLVNEALTEYIGRFEKKHGEIKP